MGSPLKYFVSPEAAMTLNRASLQGPADDEEKRRQPAEPAIGPQGPAEGEQGRGDPEGDEIGQRIILDAELGGGP